MNNSLSGSPILLNMGDVHARPVPWLWRGRIPLGRLTLVVGRPGCGKSLFTCDAAARVTKGAAWPDGHDCPEGSVLMISAEDDPSHTIRPRLDAAGADASRVTILQGVQTRSQPGKHGERAFTLADLAPLEEAMRSLGEVRLVVVDPIGDYLGSGVDAHRDNEVRAVLAPLAALAERHSSAFVAVSHTRKAEVDFADDAALGSRAFTGIARSVLHLLADPTDPSKQGRLLLPGKSNLGRPAPGLSFEIVGGEDEPGCVRWFPGTIDLSADDVVRLARAKTRKAPALEAAKEFLREVLRDGPLERDRIEAEAEAEGVSEASLKRAKQDLGVLARKRPGKDGPWTWQLPDSIQGDQAEHGVTP